MDILASHSGHIIPIFKAFYYLEVNLFGTVSILYLYTNLILYFITYSILFYFLKEKLQINKYLAIILTAILTVHPINFNSLLWTFQSSQLLQLLFQFSAILAFINFFERGEKKYLFLTVLCLIIQNYLFGNGLLMPIPMIIGSLMLSDKKLRLQSLAVFSLILLGFIFIQISFADKNSLVLIDSIKAFFYYNSVNLFRFFFIKNLNFLNPYLILFLIFPVLLLIIKFKTIIRSHRLILFLFWFGCVSTLIPIARSSLYLTDFPPYYSFGSFLPFSLFLIELFKDDLAKIYENKRLHYFSAGAILVIFLTCFMVDRRMVATFSVRNYKNEANLNNAIKQNREYFAYDDPYFIDPAKLPPQEEQIIRVKDPKGAYLHLKTKNKFNFLLPTSVANDGYNE